MNFKKIFYLFYNNQRHLYRCSITSTLYITNPSFYLLKPVFIGPTRIEFFVERYAFVVLNFQLMVAKSKKPRLQTSDPIKSELLFKVSKDAAKWYLIEDSSISSSSSKSPNEKYDKQTYEQIYQSEYELYQKLYQQDQSSDYQWLQTSLSTTSKVKIISN